MAEAAALLEGTHDFASFCSPHTTVQDTVRTIYACRVIQEGNLITIRVSGSGFLYNMVRIIAGTLMDVGSGFYPPEEIENILAAKDRTAAGPTAPACGLTMIGIEYEEDPN